MWWNREKLRLKILEHQRFWVSVMRIISKEDV